jgi:HK97 family phage prohead protease
VKGAISDTPLGREVYTLLKDGALDEMSIGFDPVEYFMTREPGQTEDVRHLTAVHLWEVSVVSFAANRDARVASVHRRVARPRYRPDIAAQLRELDLLCLEQGFIPPDMR